MTRDPFITDNLFSSSLDTDLSHVPPHLLTIYALSLGCISNFTCREAACNALLAVLACLLLAISPSIETPFITLQSSNRVLGVDAPILTLPVCPVCRNVYPSASSRLSHDECTDCNVPLFLPSQTKRGNDRSTKTPIVKYPYLPLSEQIKSMLKIPGLEAILDDWRSKPRSVGTYTDIFDGDMCRKKLKDPDGKLFFSNSPGEKSGPNDELRIGVNLGIDWQLSCKYRYRTANLLCTSILPGLKEQNPDQIQRFLRPIVSDLLRLWKNGIKVLTESCPEGRLVRVILVAVIPQLWSACLPVDASGEVLNQRLDVIQRLETQKQRKKQGTDAYALEKARIAQENLALAEAKKTAKLKAAAAKEAEKLRLATEKKARAALKCTKPPPPPPPQFNQQDAGDDSENLDDLKFSLHPDDPDNFLKLCSALRILVRYVICDVDINEADRLLREYTTGLIKLYGATPGTAYYGELLEIFQFELRSGDSVWFGRMRWFKPWHGTSSKVWDDFTSVDICLWELGEYIDQDTQLPALIDLDWITGQVAMTTVSIGDTRTKVWATILIPN
ncbi:hypothetical protein DFH29DRAFT_999846 [Suillus ampliporus]|nr:hypothetical protein DFH29DRAFT_999846 [Suillus ampliporus]